MAKKIEIFKLPSKWDSPNNEDQNSPRLYLKNSINLDLPISGGWGYSKNDSVIIDKDDPLVTPGIPFDWVGVEYAFVEKRIYAELIVFRESYDRFSGIDWKLLKSSLKVISNRKYEVLEYMVSGFLDKDFEFLKEDWEINNGYEDDEKGRAKHLKIRDQKMYYYDSQYWFDITSLKT